MHPDAQYTHVGHRRVIFDARKTHPELFLASQDVECAGASVAVLRRLAPLRIYIECMTVQRKV
jgi:hypothetical protein